MCAVRAAEAAWATGGVGGGLRVRCGRSGGGLGAEVQLTACVCAMRAAGGVGERSEGRGGRRRDVRGASSSSRRGRWVVGGPETGGVSVHGAGSRCGVRLGGAGDETQGGWAV